MVVIMIFVHMVIIPVLLPVSSRFFIAPLYLKELKKMHSLSISYEDNLYAVTTISEKRVNASFTIIKSYFGFKIPVGTTSFISFLKMVVIASTIAKFIFIVFWIVHVSENRKF